MSVAAPEAETELATPTAPHTRLSMARIVLTGFMGAGKSTVGRLLAAKLRWTFADVDALVEEDTRLSIADIFAQRGELAFRALESQTIARCLGQHDTVVALGGGAPEILGNRLLLEQTPGTAVVFLDAPFATLYDRCTLQGNAPIRPVLANPAEAARRFEQRAPLYRRIARLHIATGDLSAQQTVDAILANLSTPS